MKTGKRFLFTIVLMLCICTNMLSAVIQSGSCGDNVTYTLTDDGVLSIQGKGEMKDSWYSWRKEIKKVIIGQGVTSICSDAFGDCYNLTSVTIPNSVTSIGQYAFEYCM